VQSGSPDLKSYGCITSELKLVFRF